jgi:DNA helicase II / ATP-dependent DNA helicase PcrA
VAALIERAKEGQSLDAALPALNEILLQCATPEQREILEQSGLDSWLRDTERDPAERPTTDQNGAEPSLDPFIPRRGRGLMLSASDIDTYRICPLKYKFARVFRIPQEPTIHQRFGIVLHQVLERFHGQKRDDRSAARTGRLAHDGSLDSLMELFHASWRRGGFGDSDDELQFRDRAVQALRSYWERDREADSEAIWFERSFAFKIGPHLLRGRVDRVDRHPDGTFELIDYKTGRAKTEQELREDVQLSVYQMGARESWGIETSAQSYFYVLTGEKVPVAHSEEELERVRSTITEIAAGILKQRFEPTPSPDVCRFCDYRIICPAAEK